MSERPVNDLRLKTCTREHVQPKRNNGGRPHPHQVQIQRNPPELSPESLIKATHEIPKMDVDLLQRLIN